MADLPFPDPPLADEVIRLRPWLPDDVDAAHEAVQDPLIPRFTRVPEGQTKEEITRFIEGREPARRSGIVLSLVIADARSGALMGTVSLMGVDWEQRRGDVGFWTASGARGRGAATRAVRMLSRWALTELGLARIQLGTYTDNHASQRVAERCGFVREGVLRAFLEVKGHRHDIVMFSLLVDDLTEMQRS